jgi:hypothetical protein
MAPRKRVKKKVVRKSGKEKLSEKKIPGLRYQNLKRKIKWNNRMIKLLERHIDARENHRESPLKMVSESKKNFREWFGTTYEEGPGMLYLHFSATTPFAQLARQSANKLNERNYRKALSEVYEMKQGDVDFLITELKSANKMLSHLSEIEKHVSPAPPEKPLKKAMVEWFHQPEKFLNIIDKQVEEKHGKDTMTFKLHAANYFVEKMGLPKQMEKNVRKMVVKRIISRQVDKVRIQKDFESLKQEHGKLKSAISTAKSAEFLPRKWVKHFEKTGKEAHDQAFLSIEERK